MGTVRKLTGADEQARAARSAGAVQAEAASTASDLAEKMYEESKERLSPFVSAGTGTINNLSSLMSSGGGLYDTGFTASDFENYKDPSYDWRVEQGQNALASQAAAAGNYGSGNMGTALVDYGQNAASQEYQNAYNRYMNSQNTLFDRLYNMSALGSNAASGLSTLGANTAASQGEYATQGANALASGMTNYADIKANANTQNLNQLMSLLGGSSGTLSAFGSGAASASGTGLESLLGLGAIGII